jgi:quinol monooxygenase YgiN
MLGIWSRDKDFTAHREVPQASTPRQVAALPGESNGEPPASNRQPRWPDRSATKTRKLAPSGPAVRIRRRIPMVSLGLYVRLEAKPGKEAEVAQFIKSGLPLVEEEAGTIAWFGVQLSKSTFGIFDAFENQAGQEAHLNGKVAAALMAKASELFAQAPAIEKVEILAAKLPASSSARQAGAR